MSIYNIMFSEKEMKAILKPCSNRNYGGYYAIIAFTFLTILLAIVIVGRILYFLWNKLSPKISNYMSDLKKSKAAEEQSAARLLRFKGFEKDLFLSDNTLYYVVKSYKNSNNHLTTYVDFYTKDTNGCYNRVSDELDEYLANSVGYNMIKYTGRSKKLEGTRVVIDMGQMYLENALNKAYGEKVNVEYLDSAYVSFI